MTVDLVKLKQCLAEVEAEPGADIAQRDINPYLLENAILPFLNGEAVDMGSLDYSAFSSDDIVNVKREIEENAYHTIQTARVKACFRKAPPTVRQIKAFC